MNAPHRIHAAPTNVSRVPTFEPRRGRRKPLGQVLVERGFISAEQKLEALELQTRHDAPLGQLIISRGLLNQQQVDQALAMQYGTEVADLRAVPPDIALIDRFGIDQALETGHLPWQRHNDHVLVASARPDTFESHRTVLEALYGPVRMMITHQAELHEAVIDRHPLSLANKAETRVRAEESCRGRNFAWPTGLMAVVVASCALLAPKFVFYALLIWALVTLVLQTALKAVAFALQLFADRPAKRMVSTGPLVRLPTVSILVALYKEREIAARLVENLVRIDYPPELLDICLVVESDDRMTQDALDATNLPPNMRKIVVPDATLKTKPRALNYALEFCRGSIVGVYDAEDAPAADQIRRVADRFHSAPQEVACLQGVLDYYNPHRNWLARCFTIEYATWFRVILPGFLRLGLVIPLGGTTLFFRRAVLDKIGCWDAHNVTEDADLGIRLARHGYRTELIDTVTKEEANCLLVPWVKQRSRWLKGYALTWAVHTRNPRQLWRDLGTWRFFGVQILLLGTLTQFAVAPLLWSFWLLCLGFGHVVHSDFGNGVVWTISTIFILSEALANLMRIAAVNRTDHLQLNRWVPTLYLYFPLATLAIYKGLVELVTKPFYWDKTSHGKFSDPTSE